MEAFRAKDVQDGFCWCGCGKPTPISTITRTARGILRGKHIHFIHGHSHAFTFAEERFWSKVNKNGPIPPHMPHLGPCWIWEGGHTAGYGQFMLSSDPRVLILAHRYSWTLRHGEIPDGLDALHHCDVRPCVNWDHLFTGNDMDNQRDAARKGRHRNPSMPGESHPLAKLTESEVKWMRYLHQAGTINQRQEAIKLGVSPSVISQIVKGKSWKHLIR